MSYALRDVFENHLPLPEGIYESPKAIPRETRCIPLPLTPTTVSTASDSDSFTAPGSYEELYDVTSPACDIPPGRSLGLELYAPSVQEETQAYKYCHNFLTFAVGDLNTDLSYFDGKIGTVRVNRHETLPVHNNSIHAHSLHLGITEDTEEQAYTIVGLIQGLHSVDAVANVIGFIKEWFKTQKPLVRSEGLAIVRFTAMQAFASIWHPLSGRKFLAYSEYDDLVITGMHSSTLFNQNERLGTTLKGMAYIKLIGSLLAANLLTGCDVATAAETLWMRRYAHGYMRALYFLIRSAGDKICRKDSRGRFVLLVDRIHEILELDGPGTYNYEFKLFSRPIIALVSEYHRVQELKSTARSPQLSSCANGLIRMG